jgi:hypothetical protein
VDLVRRLNSISDEVERQQAYGEIAARYITADPVGFVWRMGLKFARFWNVVPNAAEFRGLVYQAISAASFGPVLILAVVAGIVWRSRTSTFVPIYLLIVYFTLLHMVTIASLRYRLPLEPFLIVMAAGVVGPAVDWLRCRTLSMLRVTSFGR